jgi:hypothetical protein
VRVADRAIARRRAARRRQRCPHRRKAARVPRRRAHRPAPATIARCDVETRPDHTPRAGRLPYHAHLPSRNSTAPNGWPPRCTRTQIPASAQATGTPATTRRRAPQAAGRPHITTTPQHAATRHRHLHCKPVTHASSASTPPQRNMPVNRAPASIDQPQKAHRSSSRGSRTRNRRLSAAYPTCFGRFGSDL